MLLELVPDALELRKLSSRAFVNFCELFCEQFEAKVLVELRLL
jgi:hypothetical protein